MMQVSLRWIALKVIPDFIAEKKSMCFSRGVDEFVHWFTS
jgi:hypothetical protein